MSSLSGALTYSHTEDDHFVFPHPYLAHFPAQPHFPIQPSHPDPVPHYRPPGAKRPRQGNADDGDGSESPKDLSQKQKQPACERCKSLKVKCELKTDTQPCKRCYAAGHICKTPGRKKRRAPPKREFLLSQIRDQAAQIQKLMAQLELSNRRPDSMHRSSASTDTSNEFELTSPVISPSETFSPEFADKTPVLNSEVQDWLSKAKESIDAFGGFIGMGGATMPKSFLFNHDPEDEDSSSEYEYEDDDDRVIVTKTRSGAVDDVEDDQGYEFAVADSDGEAVIDSGRNRSRASTSSAQSPITRRNEASPRMSDKPLAVPPKAYPFGLMADMKRHTMSKKGSEEGSDDSSDRDFGVADDNFFKASTETDLLANKAPYILSHGIVTTAEADQLFQIYFDYMNLSLSLLDPVLYTAKNTAYRSSFLFTVICAISSRYYVLRPELYDKLMPYAQQAAGTTLVSGKKNVEVCIAYILLSLYPVPKRRLDEDRGWVYLGLAIRVATDINLHLPITATPKNEQYAREMLNRTRIWLNCFNLDRSFGSQYGKPIVIKNIDYIANHAEDFWESSEYNLTNFDIHLCCYNAELRVMSDFMAKIYNDLNHPTNLNKDIDFEHLATETDDRLVRLGDKWFAKIAKTDMSDPQNRFRTGLLRLAYSYARLIALSFGFQHAFVKNRGDEENPFFFRCLRAATDVVTTVVDDIGCPSQRKYLRHGPESQSVFVTFAASFLVKLLQPKFATYLTTEKRLEIRTLVQRLIDLLGSPEVAIDNRHGPKLYARFLEGLLAMPMARVDHSSPAGLQATHPLPHKKVSNRRHKSSSGQTPEPPDRSHLEVPSTGAGGMGAIAPNQTTNNGIGPMAMGGHAAGTTAMATGGNGMSSGMPNIAAGFPLTPVPSRASFSFNHFAPTVMGADPFAARTTTHNLMTNMNLGMGLGLSNGVGIDHPMGGGVFEQGSGGGGGPTGISGDSDMGMMNVDFWQQPLAYDEIWQSMQTLEAEWPDMSSLPGDWLSEYPGSKSQDSTFNFASLSPN